MTQDIAILKAISAKLGYLDTRHKVLAQNIANSDTPRYRAKDVSEVDFSSVLKDITSGERLNVNLDTTNTGHMNPNDPLNGGDVDDRRIVYEVAPAGNAVILEDEIIKASQNTMEYNTMINLYSKVGNMMKIAIGKGR